MREQVAAGYLGGMDHGVTARPGTSALTAESVPRLSLSETLGVVADVFLPLLAQGVIARRRRAVGLAQRVEADRRAIRRLQHVRRGYGEGPVRLRLPARDVALVLSRADVRRVLHESPDVFTPANREKRAALSHFQPHGVLISQGQSRTERRELNEAVLDTARPVHRLADVLLAKVREESDVLARGAERTGYLTWESFAVGWWAMVRRVVLGDGARDDHALTGTLARLRRDANWAYLRPKRKRRRDRFLQRLQDHLDRAESGSLAAMLASRPAARESAAADQAAHWLFAFEAAGMASFRALALLDAHPAELARVSDELRDKDLSVPQELPSLRATVLESVRLWPTTPAILRDTTTETSWASGTIPAGTALIIFAPYFHRDHERLTHADSFCPEAWLDGEAGEDWALIPFSAGPAECPGRNLVLLITSTLLALLLQRHRFRLAQPSALRGGDHLPATLSPFDLRFDLTT